MRKYKSNPIEENILKDVLECARLAPTAMNEQPWLFGVITEKETLAKIADLTDHGKFIGDAVACFAIFGEKNAKYYLEDCCAATENIIIALQAYGIGSCWVAGEKKDYAESVRTLLGVPDRYTLVSLVPAGHPEDITLQKKKEIGKLSFFERYKEE